MYIYIYTYMRESPLFYETASVLLMLSHTSMMTQLGNLTAHDLTPEEPLKKCLYKLASFVEASVQVRR